MIFGGLAARVRILLEKDRDTMFQKIRKKSRKIPENYILLED
jgi:hypothetical protein